MKKLQTKMQNHGLVSSKKIIYGSAKKPDEKKKKNGKEDEQTLEELNSAHRRSPATCQLVQTS